jgi:hypothetical protein
MPYPGCGTKCLEDRCFRSKQTLAMHADGAILALIGWTNSRRGNPVALLPIVSPRHTIRLDI